VPILKKKLLMYAAKYLNGNVGGLFPSEFEPGTPEHRPNAKKRSQHPVDIRECQSTGMWILTKELTDVSFMFHIPFLPTTRRQ
jgi:hypothetical protein